MPLSTAAELLLLLEQTPDMKPAPHEYRGNMCGVRVPGLPPVAGGAADSSLVLSWFIDRYSRADRAKIYAIWQQRGDVDCLVSWPDSRSVGQTPEAFLNTCAELVAHGFRPCVFLASKDHDAPDVGTILATVQDVLPRLIAAGVVARVCIGWELSLWLSPTQVQQLIDAIAPICLKSNIKLYIHLQQAYFAFQQPGGTTADFWKTNVGKLTGILHQRDLSWDAPMYQARITDCLQRFAGQFNFSTDNGIDGQPFDFIALEITAQPQFNGEMDEAQGNNWGTIALLTPDVNGVRVMGSGNGQAQ